MATNNAINANQTLATGSSPTFANVTASAKVITPAIYAAGGSNQAQAISSGGIVTEPNKPFFFVYATAQTNVTGDGTAYLIQWANVVQNQGSNFNTGTGVFTAPVTGIYSFTGAVEYTGVLAGHADTKIVLSGSVINWPLYEANQGVMAVGNPFYTGFAINTYMTAADTLSITTTVSGSTKTITVAGNSWFSGYLVG